MDHVETVLDGQLVLIDPEDAPLLYARPWKIRPVGTSKTPRLRVVAYDRADGKCRTWQLHREILGDPPQFVVFASGNPFDLRRANLVLSDKPHNFLPCPFSPARLHELYWQEQVSRAEIGRLAALAIGHPHPICYEAVDRWLSEAGLELRDRSEAMAVRHARPGEPFETWRLRGVRTHAENVRSGRTTARTDHLHTVRIKRKAKQRQRRSSGSR